MNLSCGWKHLSRLYILFYLHDLVYIHFGHVSENKVQFASTRHGDQTWIGTVPLQQCNACTVEEPNSGCINRCKKVFM